MCARVRSVVEIAASVAVDCQFEASKGMWNRVRVPDKPVSVFADNDVRIYLNYSVVMLALYHFITCLHAVAYS